MNMMKQLRDEFPIFQHKIHLDVAFKCPLSNRVVEAMTEFLRDYQLTGGDKEKWFQMADAGRALIGRMINARPEEMAFVKNTTEGLNIAAWGVGLHPGDNVITNQIEHTNNIQPWLNHQQFGVSIRWVKVREGRIVPEEIKALMDEQTRIVALSAVQYTNGFRADLKRIGALCRERGVLFVVDAVQHLGAFNLDVKACHIDVLSCGGHKFLLGPHGVGVLYVAESCQEKLSPAFVGLNQISKVVADEKGEGKKILPGRGARKYEYGYFNFVGIAGLMASVEMLMAAGIESIERHVLALNTELVNRLQHHGATLLSPLGDHERSAIVVMKLKDSKKVSEILDRTNVIATVRDGALRVSFHYYNSIKDFDPLVECLIQAGEIER